MGRGLLLSWSTGRYHRRCGTARPHLGECWPSRLVATAATIRLNTKRAPFGDRWGPPDTDLFSTAAVISRIAASEESLPTLFGGIVSFLLINQFTMSRTEASVHPPMAIPKITGPDT